MIDLRNEQFILTVSYGDYTKGVGGTDKVILSQQHIFNQNGFSNLHIYPVLKVWDKTPKISMWGLLHDGKYQGMFLTEQIVKLIRSLCVKRHVLKGIILHHFQWTDILEIDLLLRSVNTSIFLYLHDYMTICPYGGLVRDKKFFCGTGKPEPGCCTGCSKYLSDSQERQEQIEHLLQRNKEHLTVIAPSPAAAQVWLKYYPEFGNQIKVVYHQSLIGQYLDHMTEIEDNKPLKIAFVGYQADLKGWPQWMNAVLRARNDGCNYEFYQFGTVEDHFDFIREVKVDFKQSLSAMTDALRKYQIDCAVLWSTCPETYSYTYYEAYSANCFVITNALSGNIAYQTAMRKNGIVCDYNALESLLANETELRRQVNVFRRRKNFGPKSLVDNPEILELVNQSPKGQAVHIPRSGFTKKLDVLYYNIYERITNLHEQIRVTAYRIYHAGKLDKIEKMKE